MSNFAQLAARATPIDVQLRWSDQDVNGHINGVKILTLMEEARIRATRHWTATTPGQTGPVRVARALNSTFDREVHYGHETTVWMWISRIGRSSCVFSHLLTQNNLPCVYTEVTMVFIDRDSGAPTAIDGSLRRELQRHLAPAYSAEETGN